MAFRFRFRIHSTMSTVEQAHCSPLRGELQFGRRLTSRMVRGRSDKSVEAVQQEGLPRLPTGLIQHEWKSTVDQNLAVQKQLGAIAERLSRSI